MRVSTLVRISFAVGLTLFLLWRSEPGKVGAALAHTSWRWSLGACALVVADRALMAYRWIALLGPLGRQRPPWRALMRVFFVSTFVGTFLPASVGSDAVRVWSLSRDGVPASQSLASVLLDRLLGIVSILLSAVAGLAIMPTLLDDRRVTVSFALVGAGSVAALAFVFSTRLDDLIRRLLARRPPGALRDTVLRILDALQAYRTERRALVTVFVASVAVQVLRILQAWLLGRSLGLAVPLAGYFTFIPIILLVMLLPVTINGLGTSQAAFGWSFARLGVTSADAFALSILFIALGVIGNLPGGLLYAAGANPTRTQEQR